MLAVEVNWEKVRQLGGSLAPWQWGLVVLVGSIGVWALFRLRAWFREDDGRADDHMEMLTQFRDLHRQGGISEDEYRLIKSQLVAGHTSQTQSGRRPSTAAKSAGRASPSGQMVGPRNATVDESSTSEKSPTMESETEDLTDRTELDQARSDRAESDQTELD